MDILYYPEINVPETDWAIRAFLYYDEVLSIVPQCYNLHPERYEAFMHDAVLHELVKPVNPMAELENQVELSEIFCQYLETNRSQMTKRRYLYRTRGGASTKLSRIHSGKFDSLIFHKLVDMELACHDGEWYDVEPYTAEELMFFLASTLAAHLDCRLSTDGMRRTLSMKYKLTDDYEISYQNHRRNCILKELMPAPRAYDLTSIQAFKEQHHELLRRFRNHIEDIVLNTGIDPDSERFAIMIDQLKQEKDEISARMHESNLGEIIFGRICGVLSPISGASALLNAIYNACRAGRHGWNGDQNGLRYIVLAEKDLMRKGRHM